MRVLLLGGTTEATALVGLLEDHPRTPDVVLSYAGRTSSPARPANRSGRVSMRVGGFGGREGLAEYLATEDIDLVIDALHPFAAVMPFHAAGACTDVGIPIVKVQRPGWEHQPGDRWSRVADMAGAAAAVQDLSPTTVLVTVGRQDLDPLRSVVGPRFIVRSIEPADLDGPWTCEALLSRGPFTVEQELALLRDQQVDAIVTKDSGGSATAAKLAAARTTGCPVVVVDRPPMPDVATVTSPAAALPYVSEASE